MNEQPAPAPRANKRDVIRTRINSLAITRQTNIVGPAEVIALAGALLVVLLVAMAYFYFLLPARSKLATLQLERSRLQTQLRSSQDVVRTGQTTETLVQNITQSLDGFESSQLLTADRGRMGLYDSLNQLIIKSGLRNTSGPTYLPLESTATKTSSGAARAANAKWQSVYPGIAISVTVEGPYQNLRRFIRDVENTKQFIIINSVELERATETGSLPVDAAGAPAAPRSAPVSLRLEMATYFKRSGVQAQEDLGN